MIPETALNQVPIKCERCPQMIVSFAQWFSESCGGEPPSDYGHQLTWPKIMLLTFRTERP